TSPGAPLSSTPTCTALATGKVLCATRGSRSWKKARAPVRSTCWRASREVSSSPMGRKKLVSDVELLNVAREVFVKSGFGASTKEIARQAGVSEGVIFQRFPTKEDLFFAAMIPPAADLHRLLDHPGSKGRELLEKLTFAMIEYWRETFPVLLPLVAH